MIEGFSGKQSLQGLFGLQLDTTDLSEIARNSVLMSGFPDRIKREWLGNNFQLPGYQGNDLQYTNIPNIRVAFRCEGTGQPPLKVPSSTTIYVLLPNQCRDPAYLVVRVSFTNAPRYHNQIQARVGTDVARVGSM